MNCSLILVTTDSVLPVNLYAMPSFRVITDVPTGTSFSISSCTWGAACFCKCSGTPSTVPRCTRSHQRCYWFCKITIHVVFCRCHGARPSPNPEYTLKPKKKKKMVKDDDACSGVPCSPCLEPVVKQCLGKHYGLERTVGYILFAISPIYYFFCQER